MPRARRRSALATWLAVLGGLSIALGVTGLWAQRTLGEPEAIAALAGDILERPEIRIELAIVIVDPVLEDASPELQGQRAFIVTTAAAVLGNERFVPVFEDVLRRAATRLVDGRGAVRLELDRPIDEVVSGVEPLFPELAAELAAIEPPEPEVVSEREADRLRGFIDLQRAASVALLVAGALMTFVAVLRNGARALLPLGATLGGAGLVLFGMLLLGRTLLLGAIRPPGRAEAAEAAWDVVIADLTTALLVTAAVGGIAVAAGGVLGRRA
ncbi:MAG: hypothetical protein ACRDHC_11250 [Actinomycetota bacterium]